MQEKETRELEKALSSTHLSDYESYVSANSYLDDVFLYYDDSWMKDTRPVSAATPS